MADYKHRRSDSSRGIEEARFEGERQEQNGKEHRESRDERELQKATLR
jgi:hypothetical protein